MNVFILHAEKDQAAADDLKAFLKTRGLFAEAESGARGFRPLGRSDVVIALWSKDSVFSTYRMLAEKRMLDAWADQRLVLVKLDHSFLPVGLRDQPAVDASFEANRKLVAWPAAEKAAREVINRELAERQSGGGPGDGGEGKRGREEGVIDRKGGDGPIPHKSRAPVMTVVILFLVAIAAGGWTTWYFIGSLGEKHPLYIAAWAAGTLAAIVIPSLTLFLSLGAARRRRQAIARKAAASPPAAEAVGAASQDGVAPPPAPVRAAAPQAEPAGVFVSYAHADSTRVDPVIKAVEGAGKKVWVDKGGLQAGDSWAGEIVRAIKGSKGVMIMCSPNAFESDHIKREVYLADRYKKQMFPVFIEQAQPPEDFEYFFAGVQWLELFKLPEAERANAIGRALAEV